MRVQFCFQFIFPPFSFAGALSRTRGSQQPWVASFSLCLSLSLSLALSLSLSVSRSYPRFLVAFARVAFSTNLLRHLQPPSTEVSPSTRLFLASSSPLSVTRALSFVRSFVRTTSSPPPSSSICPASLYRPFLSSCFNHPRSQPRFWPRCRAFRLSLSFP